MPHMRARCLRPSRGENHASRNQSILIGPDILFAPISLKWKIPELQSPFSPSPVPYSDTEPGFMQFPGR